MMAIIFEMFHINNDQHCKIPEMKKEQFAGTVEEDGVIGHILRPVFR
jgi:hypothetical protein